MSRSMTTGHSRVKLERDLEAKLCARVRELQGLCVKIAVRGRRGHPDRMVVLPGGRVAMVELKLGRRGVLSTHQIKWLLAYRILGVAVAVVREIRDIDELMEKMAVRGENRTASRT